MNRSQYVTLYNRLATTRTRYTECVKVTRTDGAVFRFTAHDADLRIQEEDSTFYMYKAADSFSLTALENQQGLVVSNMDVDAIISDESITEDALIAGLFDYANVEIFIAYWGSTQIGTLPLRTSWVGEVTLRGGSFTADLRGIAQKLQQVFISATSLECRWSFGDFKCGKPLATYTRRVGVTSKETNDTFSCNLGPFQNKLQWGLAKWVTGANAGGSMEIIRNFNNRIQLFLPMPFNIAPGDQLDVIYGCDKTFTTCRKDYENAMRFGGEPFLAGSDLLITYPKLVADADDGGGKGK